MKDTDCLSMADKEELDADGRLIEGCALLTRRSAPSHFRASDGQWKHVRRSQDPLPSKFTSCLTEVAFVVFISMSQFLDEYLTSGFFALMPTLMDELSMSGTTATWSAGVTSLVISALLLPFGRLIDMYGGRRIFAGGLAWTLLWTLLLGLGTNVQMLVVCRAMQGLGAAAHLPAGLSILAKMYPTGPRKNRVLSLYGAMAPLGSFAGIISATLALRCARWSVFFFIGAAIATATLASVYFTPRQALDEGDRRVQMDWLGSTSSSTGIVLSIFALTQAVDALQGWMTLYILVTGSCGVLCLATTIGIEAWVAMQPLVPSSLFQIRGVVPLFLGLLLNYGAVTLFVCYATLLWVYLNVQCIKVSCTADDRQCQECGWNWSDGASDLVCTDGDRRLLSSGLWRLADRYCGRIMDADFGLSR